MSASVKPYPPQDVAAIGKFGKLLLYWLLVDSMYPVYTILPTRGTRARHIGEFNPAEKGSHVGCGVTWVRWG